MTSFNPPATDDDASTHPWVPGPGLRWSGDGALAPKPAPTLVFELPARRRDRGLAEGVVLASVWRRLAAWIVNHTIKQLMFIIILALSGQPLPTTTEMVTTSMVLALSLFSTAYDFIFGIHGVSPGGRLFRVRITAIAGAEPGVHRALTRASVAALNEIFFFAVGAFLALVDWRRQTIHDKIAGTIVINMPVAPAVPTDPERRI